MKIKELFEKDINRNIPGVITVQLADEESIKSEILEYVITREVKDILHTFFESYEVSIKNKWSDIGVWTTGFFGSGKSHLLKMISYILSNKEIDGKNVTVEESWFKRGTLLLISGIKRDDMFFAKSYKTSIFNNSTMKITKVTEENELRVQEKRVGEDECND